MTDKQIIIEDCPHFIGECCQEYLDGVCENHKCDLKIIRELEQKLKAKEQECEELKEEALHSDYGIMKNNLEGAITYLEKENKDLSKIIDCKNETVLSLKQQLDQLKAENDQLKRQHQGDKGLITSTGKQNYQLLQEYDKLKTTLAEIKEIAEKGCYDDCGMPLDELSIILQKISEVEDETINN